MIRRDLWLAEGGWHDRSHSADGKMIQAMIAQYGYRAAVTA